MRSLITLLLLPILAYGVAMGYLWYEVKSNTDEMIKTAASFARISYDSVHTSLLGDEIGLNNIVIRPVMTQDEFRLEKVRIKGPHPGYFIIAGNNLSEGQPPESFSIQLRRLELDINSELFTILENAAQQQATKPEDNTLETLVFSLDAIGCSDSGTFTQSDYRSMGFGRTMADITVDATYDEERQHLQAETNVSFDEIYTITTTFGFGIDSRGQVTQTLNNEGIPRLNIGYEDTGYHRLRNEYCAKRNNDSVDAYIDRHIRLVSNQFGTSFSDDTVAAYKEFMRSGGKLTVNLNPSGNIPFSNLKYYKAADIPRILGLEIAINGTKLKIPEIAMANTAGNSSTGKNEQPKSSRVTDRTPPRSTRKDPLSNDAATTQKPTYRTVNVSSASRYIGKMVEVTTIEGRVRKGLLDKATSDRIHLVTKLRGGSISYPVQTTYITKFKVLQ